MGSTKKLYKLSSSQKGIVLSQIAGSPQSISKESNTMGFYCYFPSNVNFLALEQCYNELLRRHDSLRLGFKITPAGLRQYFKDFTYTKLKTVTLNGKDEFDKYVLNIKDVMPVFILKGESIKALLVDCGGGSGALIVRYHHLLTDGYSNSIIFSEFPKLYEAYSHGVEPESDELISVKTLWDYERSHTKSEKYAADKAYWRKRFNSQPNYSFPAGRRAKNETSGVLHCTITGDMVCKFMTLLKTTGATSQQQMMTMVAITVFALTGHDNFAITALSANRRTPEMKKAVGCGYNASPYFYNLDHAKPISQLISENYQDYREMLRHCSFPMLSQIPLGWKLSMKNGMNFGHSWITFSGMSEYNVSDAGYSIERTYRNGTSSQLYLGFLDASGKQFDLFLEYQAYLFSREQAEKMKSTFLKCLELCLDHPDWNIDQIRSNIDNK